MPATSLLVLVCALLLLWLTRVPAADVVWPRWLAFITLAWWLPGGLLVAHWRLPDLDLPTAVVLAAGLGLCWLVLGILIAHWWPGGLSLAGVSTLFAAGAFALSATLLIRRPPPIVVVPSSQWVWFAGLVLVATLLRLPGIGYNEFHYDEVAVLTRAREAIRGEDDAFARHTKGPGELAVATAVYRALGTADEATARLPFALASLLAVPALGSLGLRLFDARTGFWGGLLLATNGFALGLSRIVQYQGAVLLLMVLAVLSMWEFSRRGRAHWLALAIVLGTFGTVLHYEFLFITPALVWLLWLGWNKTPASPWRTLAVAGSMGAGLLAMTYLPMLVNPFFDTTQSYLGSRLGTVGRTNNVAFFVEMGTFYNSIYYFLGLLLLVGTGLWLTRRQRAQLVTLLLWFVPYLLIYLFIVEFPGTHWYIFMPAWSLLAAVPPARAMHNNQASWLHWSAPAAMVLWLAVSSGYLYLMFFRQNPEYLVNFAQERRAVYWAPYGANVPEKPRFGFPIWEGWKTVGVLSEWKALTGTYASNERSRHLRWYLGDLERVDFEAQPDFILVAAHLQEPDPEFGAERLTGYLQVGEVRVRDEPRIQIWARAPLPVPFVSYAAETFDAVFMGQAPTFAEWPDPAPVVADQQLSPALTLIQAGAAPTALAPGDLLHVHYVWRADAPLPADYKLFVHVAGADGVPIAQWDGYPRWNTARTSTWSPGTELVDHVLLPLPHDLPRGTYRLLTGLYDPASGRRLGDRTVDLGTLTVQ